MKSSRLIWAVSTLIVVFGVAVSAQIFALYGKLQNRERVIRLLSAEIQRKSAAPVRADLTSGNGQSISARLRRRAREKEIKKLAANLMIRSEDLESARETLGARGRTIRTLNLDLEGGRNKLRALLEANQALEEQMTALKAGRAKDLEEKEAALAALQQKNEALNESIETLKLSMNSLEKRNKELAKPRLPREVIEKIKEFGAR